MRFAVVLLFLLTSPAFAQLQQGPDPAFMQRALDSIAAQRNNALNAAAVAEARVAGLTEELAKATARIKELEPKPEPEKKK